MKKYTILIIFIIGGLTYYLTGTKNQNTQEVRVADNPYFTMPESQIMDTGERQYYTTPGYEALGQGNFTMIDKTGTTTLDLNAYGDVSPDKRYYVTNGDTDLKNGSLYCNAEILHSRKLPGSALKLLDFQSGKIRTLIQDKNKIFLVYKPWSEDSKTISYKEYEINKTTYCPTLINEKMKTVNI